jgi:hypothetical protein
MSFSASFISLTDLFVAYRKAKREAFDDTNCAHGLKFSNYERRLEENLRQLRRRLTASDADWSTDLEFLGRVTCIGKKVAPGRSDETEVSHFTISDPIRHWKRIHHTGKALAEFRPVIDATVEFQVVSALWIIKVGHLFEATLDSRYAVGNRLKRWRAPANSEPGVVGGLNLNSRYLFVPYYGAYGAWRERGLAAMKAELKLGNRIVAITMDLNKFYHRVDARFLLDPAFVDYSEVVLTRDQRSFNRQLVAAIETWNLEAHQKFDEGDVGVPVGLTASSLLANVLLREFDARIVEELTPAYYGRYVDDVFLVLRDGRKFESAKDVMSWLSGRLGSIASFDEVDNEAKLRIRFEYSGRSDLCFSGGKQKVFQLEGQSGLDLIDPIEEQIRKQRSEHRDLPDVPDRAAEMASRALLVTSDATLDADALRHADAVTLRRAGFALLLGAIEQHAAHVEGKAWDELRWKFFGLAQRHLLTPHGFFAYHRYLPRVLSLMVAARDFSKAAEFIEHVGRLIGVLKETCDVQDGQLEAACRTLAERLAEAILQAWTENRTEAFRLFSLLEKEVSGEAEYPNTRRAAGVRAERLFRADWARERYSLKWIESKEDDASPIEPPSGRSIRGVLALDAIETFRSAAGLPVPYWPALSFALRPISIAEITGYAPSLLSDYAHLREVVLGLRGAWMPPESRLRVGPPSDKGPTRITLPYPIEEPVRVAVTNFETTDAEWRAAVLGQPNHSLGRYRRINRLINQIIDQPHRPHYLVLPECSLPRRWTRTVAMKLAVNGISLIAGLEYRKSGNRLRNEALVSLLSDFAGYRTNVCFLQPKLAPAWHEKLQLAQIAGTELQPPRPSELTLPVYVHGDFCFGVLICSDLTTISNRNAMQGEIDCLFVPEWNPDIDTFASLMEASAQDLHAFMVQANNRQFGDSRIRAPFRQNYMRDVVRVRGGLHDYFVIGEVDYRSLRKFQNNASPALGATERFKPFPIGFKLSAFRRKRA